MYGSFDSNDNIVGLYGAKALQSDNVRASPSAPSVAGALVDTGAIVALVNRADRRHAAAVA